MKIKRFAKRSLVNLVHPFAHQNKLSWIFISCKTETVNYIQEAFNFSLTKKN